MEPGAIQDILTCGLCQKTFALADIVKFIQHKVLQCNKENYEQCFTQGTIPRNYLFSFLPPHKANAICLRKFSSICVQFNSKYWIKTKFCPVFVGFRWFDGQRFRGQSTVGIGKSTTIDIGADFNAKTVIIVVTRPYASTRKSRFRERRWHFQHTKKTVGRRYVQFVATPTFIELWNWSIYFFFQHCALTDDNDNSSLKRSGSSSMGCSIDDDLKRNDGNSGNGSKSLDIKQELSGMTNDDDATNPSRSSKISKIDLVDAESNTVNSGKWDYSPIFLLIPFDANSLYVVADPFVMNMLSSTTMSPVSRRTTRGKHVCDGNICTQQRNISGYVHSIHSPCCIFLKINTKKKSVIA